jgi:hypothetical protein
MAVMNRRELIQNALAGAAVVAISATVMPHSIEAAPLSVGKTLPPDATDEFVREVWNGHWRGHYRRRWRRRRRRWACWWHRGRRVCAWRWY